MIFLFSHRPPQDDFPFPMDRRKMFASHMMEPELKDKMRRFRKNMMRINWPMINKIREYDQKIFEELLRENPDEDKITSYVDSTHIISREMRTTTIRYFLENKDSLTHEEKNFLLENFLKKHVHKPEHGFRNKMKGRRKWKR